MLHWNPGPSAAAVGWSGQSRRPLLTARSTRMSARMIDRRFIGYSPPQRVCCRGRSRLLTLAPRSFGRHDRLRVKHGRALSTVTAARVNPLHGCGYRPGKHFGSGLDVLDLDALAITAQIP